MCAEGKENLEGTFHCTGLVIALMESIENEHSPAYV